LKIIAVTTPDPRIDWASCRLGLDSNLC